LRERPAARRPLEPAGGREERGWQGQHVRRLLDALRGVRALREPSEELGRQ
jgi:hypothetical protein